MNERAFASDSQTTRSISAPRPNSATLHEETVDEFMPLPDAKSLRRRSLNDGSNVLPQGQTLLGALDERIQMSKGSKQGGPRLGRFDHYFPPISEFTDPTLAAGYSPVAVRPSTSSMVGDDSRPRYLRPTKAAVAASALLVDNTGKKGMGMLGATSSNTVGSSASLSNTVSSYTGGSSRRVSYPKVSTTGGKWMTTILIPIHTSNHLQNISPFYFVLCTVVMISCMHYLRIVSLWT
jgi:hypothetical protein